MPDLRNDRIQKRIVLSASPSRVWRAVSNFKEFGQWFRVELEGPFVAGATTHGHITHPGYEHLTVEMQVVSIEPERYFAYRWRPNAVDPKHDYSSEPTTLVEFTVEEAETGTLLTIVESGFAALPAARREQAFRSNDGGWDEQLKNIEGHVSN